MDSHNGSIQDQRSDDPKTLQRRTITWTGDEVDALIKLEPDAEGEINFQIPLRAIENASKIIGFPADVQILLSVEAIVAKTGGIEEELRVSSNQVQILLNSDTLLEAQARYYSTDGQQLGSGPLPPTVNEATTYRLIWNITNSLHEVEGIIVNAELPSNVSWVNSYEVSAGEVDFSNSNNSVIWRLNRLPLDVTSVQLFFDVKLSPGASQIGEVANLTKKITMTATDSDTGGKIIQSILPLDTGVEHDDRASDKGIVVN